MSPVGIGSFHGGKCGFQAEDSLLVDDRLGLYVVATSTLEGDVGKTATRCALATVRQHIVLRTELLTGIRQGWAGWSAEPLLESILVAAVAQGAQAARHTSGDGDRTPCSVTALLVGDQYAAVASSGHDSLYHYRSSCVDQLARADRRDPADGPGDAVHSELVALHPDDRFILCSHSVSRHLGTPRQLAALLDVTAFDHSAARLLSCAAGTENDPPLAALAIRFAAPAPGTRHEGIPIESFAAAADPLRFSA